MTRRIVAIIGMATLAVAGGAIAWAARPAARGYYDTRRLVILSHAHQNVTPVVLLGDSIVDMVDMPMLCGQPVLNAGVAGARTAAVEALSREVLAGQRPQLVIVAVGLNDAHRSADTSDDEFLASYRAIVARARMTGATVFATTIPPVGADSTGHAGEFDRARIGQLNRLIAQAGVRVLDIHRALAGPDDITPDRFTDDGVHPNARGYGVWRQVMAQACPV